jgi:hypothetical protein
MHFVHLALKTPLSASTKLYVYRLEGVQMSSL